MNRIFILLILILHLFPFCITAQMVEIRKDTSFLTRVVMNDGNEFIGHIITEDSSSLVLSTEKLGQLTFNKKDITKISPIRPEDIKKGKYWFENPQSARYLWSPNGYGTKER